MNIFIYTIDYCRAGDKNNSIDAQYVHAFAYDVKDKGHNVQVVYLSSEDDTAEGQKHKRILPFIPSCEEYEYEGVPVLKINCMMRNRSGKIYLSGMNLRYAKNRVHDLQNNLRWEIDKVYVHFPSFFVGFNEIVSDTVQSLAVFHSQDIANLENGEKETEEFVKSFGRWGACCADVREYLLKNYWRESVLLPGGISSDYIPDKSFINYKTTRKRKNLKIVCAPDAGNSFEYEWLHSFAEKTSTGIELTVIGEYANCEPDERDSESCSKTKIIGRNDVTLIKKELMDADILLVDKLDKYEKIQIDAMACGCVPVVLDSNHSFSLYTPGESLSLSLKNIKELSGEDKKDIIESNYDFSKSITREKMAVRYLYMNNAYAY